LKIACQNEVELLHDLERLERDKLLAPVDWIPNADAGDSSCFCQSCGNEIAEPHTWKECAKEQHSRAESAERERDTMRTERNIAAEASRQGTWIWSDTDPNDLAGMADAMTITMTAQQLRSMLAKPEQELAELRGTLEHYLRDSERNGGATGRSVLWSALTPRPAEKGGE